MPIQFRCTACNQKLAITRRKAGKTVKCPACAAEVSVPTLDDAVATGALIDSPEPDQNEQSAPPEPERPREEPPTGEEQLLGEVPAAAFDDLLEDDDLLDDDLLEEEPESGTSEQADTSDVIEETPASTDDESEMSPPSAERPQVAAAPPRRWEEDEDEDDEDGFQLHRRPMDESGLDMTPMVDVTFLLLIFFMITATFSLQKSMETEAPEPDDEGAAQLPSMDDLADDSVIVEIDENDSIFVDDVQVGSISELTDVLEQKMAGEKKGEMIIEAHPLAKHGTVVQTTDAGIEVGMQRIRRASRQGE